MTPGVRWEYEAPITERFGRLVNLDVAPGFTAVSPVVASDPSGSLTGRRYPDVAHRPDKRGIQPRLGVAWRPVAGSSLVVRAGYGIYRNTSVYQSIAMLLAQQPPLSKTLSVENSAGQSADAGQRLRRRSRRHARTRLPSIRTSASATRRTGRRRCSATCRRR